MSATVKDSPVNLATGALSSGGASGGMDAERGLGPARANGR